MTPQEKDYLLTVVRRHPQIAKANELPIMLEDVDHFVVKATPAQKTNSHVSVVATDGRVRSFAYNRENIKDVLNVVLGANPTLPLTNESTAADLAAYLTEQGITIAAEELEVSYIGTTSVLVKTTKHCIRYFGQGYFALGEGNSTGPTLSNLAYSYNTVNNTVTLSGKISVVPERMDIFVPNSPLIWGTVETLESTGFEFEEDGSFVITQQYGREIPYGVNSIFEFVVGDKVIGTYTLTATDVQNLPKNKFMQITARVATSNSLLWIYGVAYDLTQGFNVLLDDGTIIHTETPQVDGSFANSMTLPEGFVVGDTLTFRAINPNDQVADVIVTSVVQ